MNFLFQCEVYCHFILQEATISTTKMPTDPNPSRIKDFKNKGRDVEV